MGASPGAPVVVQYLYVHRPGESFRYPSSRDRSGNPARLAVRYLECALVQAASLALSGSACELVLVTNLPGPEALDRTGARLLRRIEATGVRLVTADYEHRPAGENADFAASRYVFDAIRAVAGEEPAGRTLWLVDVDCVWVNPQRGFAATPAPPAVGCVQIPYPPEWGVDAWDRNAIGALAERMGGEAGPPPPWIGGEVLAGAAGDLLELVASCETLDGELGELGVVLQTEEQLLTLAAALGRIELENITRAVRRIWTGPRHGAPPPEDPATLAVWHLPSEKGLAFRRAARDLQAGREERLRRELEDPVRAMRLFNVQGAGRARQVRDDLWLLKQRALDAAHARRGG